MSDNNRVTKFDFYLCRRSFRQICYTRGDVRRVSRLLTNIHSQVKRCPTILTIIDSDSDEDLKKSNL